MTNLHVAAIALSVVLFPPLVKAQVTIRQMSSEHIEADKAMERSLKLSSLTYEGRPFHAAMQIGQPNTPYSGIVEVWWINPSKYRLVTTSPKFTQEKIVNGPLIQEKNDGDYYPRWLEDMVNGLIDPLPVAGNFRGRSGSLMTNGGEIVGGCLTRDDRVGGITDQMTWGMICFNGPDLHLQSAQSFFHSISYSDWQKFGKKQIAQTYETPVGQVISTYERQVPASGHVQGHLVTLEELKKPDEKLFAITTPTPPEQQIHTALVSTPKEESLLEHAPVMEWPSVREGTTDGYMIVYARTDKTGQVRETARHTSDQPAVESFGVEQALKYKFKPLVVNGVAEQMEMPLVLHFTSHIDNPIPILTVEQMKKQMGDCKPGTLPPGTPLTPVLVSVDETGKMAGMRFTGSFPGPSANAAMRPLDNCRFAPYVVNGVATYYKGDIELKAP